jgi:hypothetical protein
MGAFCGAIQDAKFSVIPGVNTLFQGLAAAPSFRDARVRHGRRGERRDVG